MPYVQVKSVQICSYNTAQKSGPAPDAARMFQRTPSLFTRNNKLAGITRFIENCVWGSGRSQGSSSTIWWRCCALRGTLFMPDSQQTLVCNGSHQPRTFSLQTCNFSTECGAWGAGASTAAAHDAAQLNAPCARQHAGVLEERQQLQRASADSLLSHRGTSKRDTDAASGKQTNNDVSKQSGRHTSETSSVKLPRA